MLLLASFCSETAPAFEAAGLPAIEQIKTERAAALLIDRSQTRPVVIEFVASWCEYCRNMEPVVLAASKGLGPDLDFVTIDVDEVPTFSRRLRVSALPTIVVLDSGFATTRLQGQVSTSRLLAVLTPYLSSVKEKP
jgi:thioredoxin-like negative regulator of GroEL